MSSSAATGWPLGLALAGALIALPVPACADDGVPAASAITLSGSASVLSQRRFRGLAMSDNQPAAEAEVTATHASGAYAGVLVASLAPGAAIDAGRGEVDLYGGYAHAIDPAGLTLDLGLRAYLFPGRTGLDRVEAIASLDRQIGPIDLRGGVAFSPSTRGWLRDADRRSSVYGFADLRGDVPTTPISLHAHWGCTTGGLDWVRGYCDYRLGAGATKRHWGIDASVVGTTLGHADAARVAAVDANEVWRVARTAVVLGVTFQY